MTDTSTTHAPNHIALAARYGAALVPPAGPWSPVIEALLAHRSVRAYRPDPLPEGTLETLVAAAQSAATSSNLQTWSVVAVTDPARKARLATVAGGQRHIEQCPLFLVWLADLSRTERLARAEGRELEGLPYLETFLVAALDAALAAQNATVAAESLGLSTVYIGALRNDAQAVAEELGLPPGAMAVFGLCVGHADPARLAEVKPRLPQPAILHHERYDSSDEDAHRAAYDSELGAFSARNEMSAYRWTDRVLARLGRVGALNGRDGLAAALRSLGFPLR
jgi:nitroreductase